MPLSEREIAQAVESQQRSMKAMGARRKAGRSGVRKTHSLDPRLYYNAVALGREKYGVDNVFDEPEFLRDCERHHDWFRVPQDDTGNVVCLARTGGGSPRNRFGRVKQRITFKDGRKLVENYGVEDGSFGDDLARQRGEPVGGDEANGGCDGSES